MGACFLAFFAFASGSLVTSVDLGLESDCSEVVLQDGLLLLLDLSQDLRLVDDSLFGHLGSALDRAVHPVLVVAGRLYVCVVELLSDVLPDLSVLDVRVKLDHFHVLLLRRRELVEVEPNTEESSEDARTDIVSLNQLV